MPTRYLKESIKRSPQIDSLSWFEEVVFYRLIVTVDDYGRYYGSPIILRNDLFPTKESITKKSIEDALNKLAAKGLISLYVVDGEQYLSLITWAKHQKVRATKSRFPEAPDTSADNCLQLSAIDGQMQTNEDNCSRNRNRNRNRNRISESECAPTHARGELLSFGEFNNVLLSREEYQRLTELIPNFPTYLERFSAKIAAKGYVYYNHYAAICAWYADDKKAEPDSSFDIDEFWQAALENTYKGVTQ